MSDSMILGLAFGFGSMIGGGIGYVVGYLHRDKQIAEKAMVAPEIMPEQLQMKRPLPVESLPRDRSPFAPKREPPPTPQEPMKLKRERRTSWPREEKKPPPIDWGNNK